MAPAILHMTHAVYSSCPGSSGAWLRGNQPSPDCWCLQGTTQSAGPGGHGEPALPPAGHTSLATCRPSENPRLTRWTGPSLSHGTAWPPTVPWPFSAERIPVKSAVVLPSHSAPQPGGTASETDSVRCLSVGRPRCALRAQAGDKSPHGTQQGPAGHCGRPGDSACGDSFFLSNSLGTTAHWPGCTPKASRPWAGRQASLNSGAQGLRAKAPWRPGTAAHCWRLPLANGVDRGQDGF